MFRVLRWIFGLAVLAAAVFALLNAFDQDLRPEVEQYAKSGIPSVPPGENAFYPMLGFLAPAGADPHAFGVGAAARYEEGLARATESSNFDPYDGVEKLAVTGWEVPVCGHRNPEVTCLESAVESRASLRKALGANALLLERYAALHAFSSYSNALTPHASTPVATGNVLPAQALWLASLALRANDGDTAGALDALETDMRFWRSIASQPVNLIDKAVALAVIARDARLLSDFVRLGSMTAPQLARAESLVAPLTAEERSLAMPIREEFRLMFGLLHEQSVLEGLGTDGSLSALKHPLYKRNATANGLYAIHQDYLRLASLPAAEFLRQLPLVHERHKKEFATYSWRSLYNPIGRVLLGVGISEFQHPARVHDLEGLLRLVSLQLQITKANLLPGQIAPFVAQAVPGHADPYTGAAMRWSDSDRRLSFIGHATPHDEVIWVQL